MTQTIRVSDRLFERIAALARPFVDKEPSDVILRLVAVAEDHDESVDMAPSLPGGSVPAVSDRQPRERGAVVDIDGSRIEADSVRDLTEKVMQYLNAHGHWDTIEAMAPYKTSSQRYLYARTPKHPHGNDFFVPIRCNSLYFEVHKNYQTCIKQLARLTAKCGVTLTYRGM